MISYLHIHIYTTLLLRFFTVLVSIVLARQIEVSILLME